MPRLNAALLGALTLIVLVLGLVVVSNQQQTIDRLDEIACLERLDATAAVNLLLPDNRVDVDGRVDAVRRLSEELDACGATPLSAP